MSKSQAASVKKYVVLCPDLDGKYPRGTVINPAEIGLLPMHLDNLVNNQWIREATASEANGEKVDLNDPPKNVQQLYQEAVGKVATLEYKIKSLENQLALKMQASVAIQAPADYTQLKARVMELEKQLAGERNKSDGLQIQLSASQHEVEALKAAAVKAKDKE